jgi:hypothetical protein
MNAVDVASIAGPFRRLSSGPWAASTGAAPASGQVCGRSPISAGCRNPEDVPARSDVLQPRHDRKPLDEGRSDDRDGLRAGIENATPSEVPVAELVVGIDGCFVKGINRKRKTSLEIVLGRIDVPARNGEAVAVVRRLDDLAKERVRAVMRRWGRTPDTVVRVLSEGEDGMRTMLGRWLDPTVEHRLDWWHLHRRLEKMREGLICLPLIPADDTGGRLRVEAWGIEHIRWTLWNGCSCIYSTDCAITSLRIDLESHRQAGHSAGRSVDRIDYMLQQLDEFRSYLYGNAESLVNYNIARIADERVSMAHVESTVNQLVNWRM